MRNEQTQADSVSHFSSLTAHATSSTSCLTHYITEGVEELAPDKPTQLLELEYGGLNDALAQIGIDASSVRDVFFDFQKFLYEETAA